MVPVEDWKLGIRLHMFRQNLKQYAFWIYFPSSLCAVNCEGEGEIAEIKLCAEV